MIRRPFELRRVELRPRVDSEPRSHVRARRRPYDQARESDVEHVDDSAR